MTDRERIEAVDRWLSDVSQASRKWKTAKAAQQASERVVAYLEEIRERVHDAPPELDARMAEAIARNRENAAMLAESAERQAEMESGFYEVVSKVSPPEVAEAWRMRCMEHKTWARCSMELHYNRQHLERLSKKAKLAVYAIMPEAYRHV